jgi:hypothetical protein
MVLWLLASAAASAGCTLTEDGFEPIHIDDAEARTEPTLPGVPADTMGEASGLATATSNNTEGVPSVRSGTTQVSMLEPGGADGEGTAADAGVTPVVSVDQTDAVVTVDAGPPVVTPPSSPCTSLSFGGSCYELFNSPAAWDAAEQQCVTWGGHLASIGSSEENAFLDGWPAQLGLGVADGSGIWVGGTDAQRDGEFLWVDGSPFSFAGWAAGQPDDGVGADCIEKRNDGAGQWYDRRCSDPLRYVCERPL